MRTISKRKAPGQLTQWRQERLKGNPEAEGMEAGYNALRRDQDTMQAIEAQLCDEQGGLCAYTGMRIDDGSQKDFHVEHLIAQEYCTEAHGQANADTDYKNLLACWPAPNYSAQPQFGAVVKANWPSPQEKHLFVSPLSSGCESRFTFDDLGKVGHYPDDDAVKETIEKLGLASNELAALRQQAIRGALWPRQKPIGVPAAQQQLESIQSLEKAIERGGTNRLPAYCFAIKQALERRIELLRRSKKDA